jgi:hypothetical protein
MTVLFFTLEAADSVIHDLLIAVFLVAFVMLFFLHSIRNSLIVMVSIPASLILYLHRFYYLGYTLNLMSLLGLSLVVGILVDDAIVVLENLQAHGNGKRVRAAYDGTAEIAGTVTLPSNCCRILTDCDEYGISFKYHYTVLCYGNYLHFILLTGIIYDNSLVVFSFWKTRTY